MSFPPFNQGNIVVLRDLLIQLMFVNNYYNKYSPYYVMHNAINIATIILYHLPKTKLFIKSRIYIVCFFWKNIKVSE